MNSMPKSLFGTPKPTQTVAPKVTLGAFSRPLDKKAEQPVFETFEAREAYEAAMQENEQRVAGYAFGKTMTQNRLQELNAKITNAIYTPAASAKPAPIAAKTMQMKYDGKTITVEFGKTYSSAGYSFKLWNPADLSQKQKAVVAKFCATIADTEPDSYNKLAPFIDVIFAFNRSEITMAQFQRITGVELIISTFDYRHDHNL